VVTIPEQASQDSLHILSKFILTEMYQQPSLLCSLEHLWQTRDVDIGGGPIFNGKNPTSASSGLHYH
jgi:hypothetical protein